MLRLCFEKPLRRVDHGKCNICTISRSSSLSNNTGRLFYLETGCNNGASGGHRGEVKSSQQQQQQHKEIRTEDGNKRTACVEICGKALHSFHRGGETEEMEAPWGSERQNDRIETEVNIFRKTSLPALWYWSVWQAGSKRGRSVIRTDLGTPPGNRDYPTRNLKSMALFLIPWEAQQLKQMHDNLHIPSGSAVVFKIVTRVLADSGGFCRIGNP